VGELWNDNGSIHQAIPIDPFNITNAFANYTIGGTSRLAHSRLRLAVNNLGDIHPITAVAAASTKTNLPAPGDVLTLMAGRSVSASITIGFSPKSH
jgi:iron complex outermembrane receptor protein